MKALPLWSAPCLQCPCPAGGTSVTRFKLMEFGAAIDISRNLHSSIKTRTKLRMFERSARTGRGTSTEDSFNVKDAGLAGLRSDWRPSASSTITAVASGA